MSKHFIWAVAAVLCVAAVAHATATYSIEAAKQEAFMLKACVDAGGQFRVIWGNPRCARQEGQP